METSLGLETRLLLLLLVLFSGAKRVSPRNSLRLELVTPKLLLLHHWLLPLVLVRVERAKHIHLALRRPLGLRDAASRREWLAGACPKNVVKVLLRCLRGLLLSRCVEDIEQLVQ